MSTEMTAGRIVGDFSREARQAVSDTGPVESGRKLTAKELLDTEPVATLRLINAGWNNLRAEP